MCYLLVSGLWLVSVSAQAYQAFSTNNTVIIRNGQMISSSSTVTGSGVLSTQTRSLRPFNEIRLHVPGKVQVVRGSNSKCVVTIDDNLLPIISTEVQGKVLTITGRKGFSSTNEVLLNITT
ncbi:hypothetical protein TI03_04045, partial [Achromatium sp. WMS1]